MPKTKSKISELAMKTCIPCSEGVPALHGDTLKKLLTKLEKEWELIDEKHIEREFLFDDFKQSLEFTNRLGDIAEREGHHPDIYLAYGVVKVMIWTHKIHGLSESDFILAAKYDRAFDQWKHRKLK